MAKNKKRVFRKELIVLTMSIYISSMLILGITFSGISVTLFSDKAKSDMIFYLENFGEQFDAKSQFMEDVIKNIRHDKQLNDFFQKTLYDVQMAKMQLAEDSDLFAERNLVDSKYPFVERIYIFNNRSEFISNHFYPTTRSYLVQLDKDYQKLYYKFNLESKEYLYRVNEEGIDVCLTLYDEDMKEVGGCIAVLNMQAIHSIFKDIEKYQDCIWMLNAENMHNILFEYPSEKGFLLSELINERTQEIEFKGNTYITSMKAHGFGLNTVVGVNKNIVYSSLQPTMITFVVIFIVLLFGIAIVVFFVTQRFTRPLKNIAEYIGGFGRSGFDTKLEEFSTQEFNDISIMFNEMTDRINDLITQNYEKKLLATQTQVRFLQSQMNPHFMFNILAMIGMKAKMQGNDEVMDLLTAFSKLVQGKIFRKNEIKITLKEEMEVVGFYLYLQSNRFKDKITYQIHYESEEVKEFFVPRLCVEPIVENAVSHGLEEKEGMGQIDIQIYQKEQKLYIEISDNGVGFDIEILKDTTRATDDRHVHIGLANTIELIHILYGSEYGINIDSTKGVGTTVKIVLPIEREVN